MNNQECNQTYEILLKMLIENRLEWVTTQVSEQIRIGKTIEREIETFKEVRETRLIDSDNYPSQLGKGPKATFPVTVDYEPAERLGLLIDAIEQTVVNTAGMEHHLVEFLEKDDKSPHEIHFIAEEPGSEPNLINKHKSTSRFGSANKLKDLLNALRKEI